MATDHLTAARLRQLLSYDPATGDFRWLITPSAHITIGQLAGGAISRGYRMIRLDRVKYLSHRLAWLYVHGEWPAGLIDHRNGIPSDNWIDNLRIASDEVNHQNLRRARRDNATGYLGVSFDAKKGRFIAAIVASGKRHKFGGFMTAEAAHEAYLAAKRRLHPGCTI